MRAWHQKKSLEKFELIESYPVDKYLPSYLVCGIRIRCFMCCLRLMWQKKTIACNSPMRCVIAWIWVVSSIRSTLIKSYVIDKKKKG